MGSLDVTPHDSSIDVASAYVKRPELVERKYRGEMYSPRSLTLTKKEKSMSVFAKVQDMVGDLIALLEDAQKFDAGNNAAGTRVRKGMMDIKRMAQVVREEVSAVKSAK